jgi:hypothetical protein
VLLGTAIAGLAVLVWSALNRPGWSMLRGRPLAAAGALAAVSIVSLALSGLMIDGGARSWGHPEGANGYLGALYEMPPGDQQDRPAGLRLQLRRLHGQGAPYSVAARGTLTTLADENAHFFHGNAVLLNASGRPVGGCAGGKVDAFTMPKPPDTTGGESWGLIVKFPPTCPVSAGEYQESEPLPEPAALAAWSR